MLNKIIYILLFLLSSLILNSCYSFTGGSPPEHLKSINIQNVTDISGFGNPEYKEILFQQLLDDFQRNKSLNIEEFGGDSKLIVVINSIIENPVAVNLGELETSRRITFVTEVEFYDNLNQKSIFKRNLNVDDIYQIADGINGRNDKIRSLITKTSEDILHLVVSGW